MRILMTGGTGLIGRRLCAALSDQGHQLTVLSRRPEKVPALCGALVRSMSDLDQYTCEQEFDVVINLAGEAIVDARWSTQRKATLRQSRITLTEHLIQRIAQAKKKPAILLSGSAIGIYGDRGDELIDETASAGGDFGAQMCVDWEAAALSAARFDIRVCLLRTGLVLDRAGGIFKKMRLPFLLGLGSRIGDGRQWMSWIHVDDYVSIVLHLISNPQASGSINMVAPQAVTNRELTHIFASSLHRPAFLVTPAWLLRLALGEMSELLTGGQHVIPQRLKSLGYVFSYPTLGSALENLNHR
ncbi:MAG: TIGR01777 family oxidoreductase [Burkholderiales bacterium]|nr:TIGR01777 family oxidoreductase [Burkholderiales bacterium]